MITQNAIAFKEWAVVVEALLGGKQTIILRKGGIIEKKGEFTVDHTKFLLFPTFLHQNDAELIPEERENLKRLHAAGGNADTLRISGFMQVEQVHFLEDFETVKRVQPFGIWSLECLEERFNWGDKTGIHLIVGRVYKLAAPATFPMLPKYGGCKSWVELEKTVSLNGARPVLSDAQFVDALSEIASLRSQ